MPANSASLEGKIPVTPIGELIPEVSHSRRLEDRLESGESDEPIDPASL